MVNSKIKKIIFLIFLISPNVGYTNKIKLGLNGGINFSTITASNATKEFNMGKGFLPGMLLGIVSEYELDNDLYLITEINYSSKGYSNNQLAIRVKSYSKYLTIPLPPAPALISSITLLSSLGSLGRRAIFNF